MLVVGREGDRAAIDEYELPFTEVAVALPKFHEIGSLLFDTKAGILGGSPDIV